MLVRMWRKTNTPSLLVGLQAGGNQSGGSSENWKEFYLKTQCCTQIMKTPKESTRNHESYASS